ncbi:diadenosine tetraphosphate hydrolase [Micromonospora deserti]|uniref:Diadenosine tetraphosphate hydrolase n=1 Tax=Micromonospora deserti TaxID=2070366 RepID=A0A2W2C343_9ACTN|nr:diadenosine tetraphosphate hydrolase [Micromonospora deserti]PZF87124.1 diadenosine tetraphosphate hydrolase [Micromonospora deserti]
MSADWRAHRVRAALHGTNPTVLRRLSAGFAVIGDVQHLPGYCVLITDDPTADRLTDLPRHRRLAFLADMDLLGEAVARVCARRDPGFRRINYEILGNLDTFLHAHVRPRYRWEPAALRDGPVYRYPDDVWRDPAYALWARHDALRARLTAELEALAGDRS